MPSVALSYSGQQRSTRFDGAVCGESFSSSTSPATGHRLRLGLEAAGDLWIAEHVTGANRRCEDPRLEFMEDDIRYESSIRDELPHRLRPDLTAAAWLVKTLATLGGWSVSWIGGESRPTGIGYYEQTAQVSLVVLPVRSAAFESPSIRQAGGLDDDGGDVNTEILHPRSQHIRHEGRLGLTLDQQGDLTIPLTHSPHGDCHRGAVDRPASSSPTALRLNIPSATVGAPGAPVVRYVFPTWCARQWRPPRR